MPKIGDIRKHSKSYSGTSIWAACVDCGKERWVSFRKGKLVHLRCNKCSNVGKTSHNKGAANPRWKGGKSITTSGYIHIWLSDDDFFYPMADKRSHVMEHRLVMAKHLKRNLHSWELVHHKGTKYPLGSIENKQDNRIENLLIIVTGNKGNRHTHKITCPYCQRDFRVL